MKIMPVDGSTADSGTWIEQRLSPEESEARESQKGPRRNLRFLRRG